jgi:hypothetical protein
MFNKWTAKNNTRVVRCVPRGAACPRGETRKMYEIVVGKVREKRPIARPRYRCKNRVKMVLKET